jgi:pyruvate/2-oxoglutarate dehydrogenase complex dihydrolipoamide acyltransferase (E2) component
MIIELVAVQRCGPHMPGEEFRANTPDARALLALGRAVRKQEYMTRDMVASTDYSVREVVREAAREAIEEAAEIVVSDAVREFAKENHIDIASIQGTGMNGRILKRDIQDAIDA